MPTSAGWQPDPTGRHEHRYFDGTSWTGHVADNGVASIDSLAPGPTATTSDHTAIRASQPWDAAHGAPTDSAWSSPSTPSSAVPFGAAVSLDTVGGPVSMGRRISGYCIELALGLTVSIPMFVGWGLVLGTVLSPETGLRITGIVVLVLSYVLSLGYSIYQWRLVATSGASTGKRLAGYALVDAATGQAPGWGRSLIYYILLSLLGGFTFGIGLIVAAAVATSDPERRTWVDKAANLRAVNVRPDIQHVGRGVAAGIYGGILSIVVSVVPWLIVGGAMFSSFDDAGYDPYADGSSQDSDYSSSTSDQTSDDDGTVTESPTEVPTYEADPEPTYEPTPEPPAEDTEDDSDEGRCYDDDDGGCSDWTDDSDSGDSRTAIVDGCEPQYTDPCGIPSRYGSAADSDDADFYELGDTVELDCYVGVADDWNHEWVRAADGTYLQAPYLDLDGENPASDNLDSCND
jgi:uncharacterized RDD family membrane protein YckC